MYVRACVYVCLCVCCRLPGLSLSLNLSALIKHQMEIIYLSIYF